MFSRCPSVRVRTYTCPCRAQAFPTGFSLNFVHFVHKIGCTLCLRAVAADMPQTLGKATTQSYPESATIVDRQFTGCRSGSERGSAISSSELAAPACGSGHDWRQSR